MRIGRDVKEVVGALMRVLDGASLSRAEIENLMFDATGELQVALDEAFIRLLEFAHDRESGREPTAEMLSSLQASLDKIVLAATPPNRSVKP